MRCWLPAASMLLLATPALSSDPYEEAGPNVRPSFEVGYSEPSGYRGLDQGYGLGFAFEMEKSTRASILLRVGFDWLTEAGDDRSPGGYSYDRSPGGYSYGRRSIVVFNWAIGGRVYVRPESGLRPYGEVDVGIRFDDSNSASDGLALTPRVGISWTSFGGAGLSLDAGFNFPVESASHYGVLPVRLSIVFP